MSRPPNSGVQGTPVSRLESAPPGGGGYRRLACAIHAALWAVDEAVSRDTALRLVHVIDRPAAQDDSLEVQSAEAALRAADAAIQETHKPVEVETEQSCRANETALIEESRAAAMILCRVRRNRAATDAPRLHCC